MAHIGKDMGQYRSSFEHVARKVAERLIHVNGILDLMQPRTIIRNLSFRQVSVRADMKGGKGKYDFLCGFHLIQTMDRMQSIMTNIAVMMVSIRKLLFKGMEGDGKNHIRILCLIYPATYVNKRLGLSYWEECQHRKGGNLMESRKGRGKRT